MYMCIGKKYVLNMKKINLKNELDKLEEQSNSLDNADATKRKVQDEIASVKNSIKELDEIIDYYTKEIDKLGKDMKNDAYQQYINRISNVCMEYSENHVDNDSWIELLRESNSSTIIDTPQNLSNTLVLCQENGHYKRRFLVN